MSSYFFFEATKNTNNAAVIEAIEQYADRTQSLLYLLDRPLTDQKYSYGFSDGLILLSPKHKIHIMNFGDTEEFQDYVEDIIEDIGSISDKYLYKEIIGRPRKWKDSLISIDLNPKTPVDIDSLSLDLKLSNPADIKKIDLLISLFIGSINNMDRVKIEIPETALDKVKQKIQLFDGDQTRFVYKDLGKKRVRIQGLSGTGKTELLLHKLKDIYIKEESSKIFFTCHNKILANNLKRRIPDFFNFMKVEQQIQWNERLWCDNSWGSRNDINSGAYRYICHFYGVTFHSWSMTMPFNKACTLALQEIKNKYSEETIPPALTFMFIDESQDFDEAFFELCEVATEKVIYIAGDIFQSIFDDNFSNSITPDFLLGKCYRTDPKTLMFAHGMGMGLFEDTKLRWLEEKEWRDCGYNYRKEEQNIILSREPLRRFEDLDDNFESIKLLEVKDNFTQCILDTIKEILVENPTAKAEDIGIILLDQNQFTYQLADQLEFNIKKHFQWNVNKAYETKSKEPDSVLISNRNNVKGLEFPFVICFSKRITNSASYRNSLYTMLSRSFLKTYFITWDEKYSGLTSAMRSSLEQIMQNHEMVIKEPSEEEKKIIQTRFEGELKRLSHYDLMTKIFKELGVEKKFHEPILQSTNKMGLIESDYENLKAYVKDNMKYLPNTIL